MRGHRVGIGVLLREAGPWLALVLGACVSLVSGLLAAVISASHSRVALACGVIAAAGLVPVVWAVRRLRRRRRQLAWADQRVGRVRGRLRRLRWGAGVAVLCLVAVIPIIGSVWALRAGEVGEGLFYLLFACFPAAYAVREASFGIAVDRTGWVFQVSKAGLSHCAANGLLPWRAIRAIRLERRSLSVNADVTTHWLVFDREPGADALRNLRPHPWLLGGGGQVHARADEVSVNLSHVAGKPQDILRQVVEAGGLHGWNATENWMRRMKLSQAVAS